MNKRFQHAETAKKKPKGKSLKIKGEALEPAERRIGKPSPEPKLKGSPEMFRA